MHYAWSTYQLLFSVAMRLSLRLPNGEGSKNIVLIIADDQDSELFGMMPMQRTRELFSSGVEFKNAFVTTPVCCPSRASILSGLYAHNHRTLNNSLSGNCFGEHFRNAIEPQTFPNLLKKFANYTTFFAGKYLNKYNDHRHVPRAWHSWNALLGNSRYYNYTLSVNGSVEHHGDAATDYLTNVITEKALEFLDRVQSEQTPFFLMLCPPAPHAPFTPLPAYANRFNGLHAPRTPAYNRSGAGKHWFVRTAYPLSNDVAKIVDRAFRDRWRTLLSVDDMVAAIVAKLKAIGKDGDTYIIYTSDNGYHMGQFAMPLDKRQPYEFDIRVPLLVRLPSERAMREKLLVEEPVLNIDLAPTILSLADVPKRFWPHFDGKSFAGLLRQERGRPRTRREFLVEYWGEHDVGIQPQCRSLAFQGLAECSRLGERCVCEDATNNTYVCLRRISTDEDFIFCEFADSEAFNECYELKQDPYQLENIDCSRYNKYRLRLQKLKATNNGDMHI